MDDLHYLKRQNIKIEIVTAESFSFRVPLHFTSNKVQVCNPVGSLDIDTTGEYSANIV